MVGALSCEKSLLCAAGTMEVAPTVSCGCAARSLIIILFSKFSSTSLYLPFPDLTFTHSKMMCELMPDSFRYDIANVFAILTSSFLDGFLVQRNGVRHRRPNTILFSTCCKRDAFIKPQ